MSKYLNLPIGTIILTSYGRLQRNHIADRNMYSFMRVVYAEVYDAVHVISISSSYSPGWGCSLWVFHFSFSLLFTPLKQMKKMKKAHNLYKQVVIYVVYT